MQHDDLIPLPHDLTAEEAVLSAVFKRSSVLEEIAYLRPEHFFDHRYQAIFRAMRSLNDRGEPADYTTINAELAKLGDARPMGTSLPDLTETNLATGIAAHVEHYAAIVAKKAMLRRVISAGSRMVDLAYSPDADAAHVLATADALVRNASDGMGGSRLQGPEHWVMGFAAAMAGRTGKPLAGISTGLLALDRITLGLSPSRLYLIPARTGMGKTILVQQVALHVAAEHGPVAFFSLEMAATELAERAVAMRTGIRRKALATGRLSREDHESIDRTLEHFATGRLHLAEGSYSALEIRRECLQFQAEVGPLSLVVVDYAQLLTDSAGTKATRDADLALAARRLKQLAQDLKVPVLVPAQLNRAVEGRANKRPILSDIRECGSFEAECDVAAAVYRDDYYDPRMTPGSAELITLKQRHAGDAPGTSRPLVWLDEGERYADEHPQFLRAA